MNRYDTSMKWKEEKIMTLMINISQTMDLADDFLRNFKNYKSQKLKKGEHESPIRNLQVFINIINCMTLLPDNEE